MSLRDSLRANSPFLLVAGLYLAAALSAFTWAGLPLIRPWSYLSNALLYAAAAVFLLGPLYLYKLLRTRPESPIAFGRDCARDWLLRDRFLLAAPALVALIFFMPAFSAFKSAIPAFHAYSLDPLFIRMDEVLHGQDAWRLIHPIVGYPIVSFILNTVYHLWVALLYVAALPVIGWVERPRLRMQFLLSYALCWSLLGTLGAILTASVGPCFYEAFYGDDRFQPLMEYLARADASYPLMALEVQQQLLLWAADGSNGIGRGISAMPSMHLSIACVFALLGWRISRTLGIAGTIFLVLILIGSVHLGYHYAIDGYVAIIATLAIWWLSGVVVKAIMPRDANASASILWGGACS